MPLRIYDTLTGEKREFAPVTPGQVRMYVCGMTVQNKPHVGHMRASLSGEVMRRYLEHLGYAVTYVYNFTDVDDKIIERANAEGIEWQSVSERNIEAYLRYADLHNIKPASIYPRATRHIAEMHAIIARLIERGHAYAAGGDVYFDVRSKPDYGKLSGRRVDEMREGYRIEPGEAKRDPLDFALWKGSKPGEPAWDSPWGPGRPGWHIECSAMAMKYLGETFDIHGGGQDLIFPHHENEIAQSEAATGKPFANFWCENGMVNLGGEKMSKSTGNLFFIEDIAAQVDPEVVRYYLLSTHYRSPIDFTLERLKEAATAYQRLRLPLERAGVWEGEGAGAFGAVGALGGSLGEAVAQARRLFAEAMEDDFNTARAMGHLFDLAREVNRAMDEGAGPEGRSAARALFDLGQILGLFWKAPAGETWEPEVLALVQAREAARKSKDWKQADEIRGRLLERGVTVEDGPQGPKLKKK
ncbi:MAG: cysteine--tRNA ligase [Candidatus Eisenbacteria bacterium]|uniref:Cysteine--tRNA ligase n=1 Tax=Eiseniibacteriota bacterium TaxID=2212470 RepID=A0A538U801_UNCEI|nr:MAG: cysteine--tRNA ligase [Candidatus Eisenbacteria bacterium]